MSLIKIFGLILLMWFDAARCQVSFPGECPAVKVKRSINLNRLCGIWYEYERYPFLLEDNQKCIETEVYGNSTGSITIQHRLTDELDSSQKFLINGWAKLVAPGKFTLKYSNIPAPALDAWLLDTDYTSYAVVYSCYQNTLDAHLQYLWIMTRDPIPSRLVQQKAYNVLNYNGLSSSPMSEYRTDQSTCTMTSDDCNNCRYFPTTQTDSTTSPSAPYWTTSSWTYEST